MSDKRRISELAIGMLSSVQGLLVALGADDEAWVSAVRSRVDEASSLMAAAMTCLLKSVEGDGVN